MATADFDLIAERLINSAGAIPAFKGYHGYPATICASVNEEVIHGIPSGDARWRRATSCRLTWAPRSTVISATARSRCRSGGCRKRRRKLLRVTEESLYKAIDVVRAGDRLSDIGHAVQRHVEEYGFSVVREFVGHGIGERMHEEPQVPNYGEPGRGPRLAEGMVLAIEPMVNAGQAGGEGARRTGGRR